MRSSIWQLALLAIITTPSLAEEPETRLEQAPVELNPIVVVASKTPRPLADVVGHVSVIDAAFINRYLVEDIDGLLAYEPGLNLEGSGTRFGANAINIRGIGGNRVAIEVDGIPLRDRFAIGSFSDGGRIMTETDRIKQLEVLYGPASTLYGADALGGVVAITTWDPDDLLSKGDGKSWFSLRIGYQGVNNAVSGSGLAAWGSGNNGLLFAATWRDGHELDNRAPGGTLQDQQSWDKQDYLLRYTRDTATGNRLRITLSDYNKDTKTRINSLPGHGRFRRTTSLAGDDGDENRQVSLDYAFHNRWGKGVMRVFDVSASTRQLTHEERAASSRPVRLQRYFRYDQDFSGLEFNLFRDLSWGNSGHHLGVGVEIQRTDSSEFRDGFQQSLIDGLISKSVLGENLPVRDFPNSRSDELAVFLQDEISFSEGRWELIPALRFDHYKLDPRPDALYLDDNPDTPVVTVNDNKITPRAGVMYHLNTNMGMYAQLVNGFRAPPFEDANIGLDIPLFNIRAIPNPDLKSETSIGIETGFRYITGSTRLTLALFGTDYDDFIETKARIGVDPESGVLLFQSRNIDRARIYGLDVRFEQALAGWRRSLEGWSLTGAAYWSKGENRENGRPLNSVSPPQVVLGVSWSSVDDHQDAHLTVTHTARQKRIDETAGLHFHTPAWTTLDLTGGWHVNDHFDLRGGIYNLADKRYWRWSDVSLFTPDNPMLELLSRPGRNYSVTARFQW